MNNNLEKLAQIIQRAYETEWITNQEQADLIHYLNDLMIMGMVKDEESQRRRKIIRENKKEVLL